LNIKNEREVGNGDRYTVRNDRLRSVKFQARVINAYSFGWEIMKDSSTITFLDIIIIIIFIHLTNCRPVQDYTLILHFPGHIKKFLGELVTPTVLQLLLMLAENIHQ
jgi:hypothetical protein